MSEITVRPQEQLLIDALTALDAPPPRGILCTSQGFAQLAAAATRRFPEARVVCHYLDLYRADLAREFHTEAPSNLMIACSADFPADKVELAALPMTAQGEAELTRELLEEAHDRLDVGGIVMTSTDNPRDRWLHGEMQKLFDTVSRREHPGGAVYLARKTGPLARRRNFACELAFRDRAFCDRDRLIYFRTRPGVFSHRKVDPGARQLMAAMEIHPGDRVLDIGCGSGVVALAAAVRAEGTTVLAFDSNARAVECTRWSAGRNELTNLSVQHSATGPRNPNESFDVALANPPYFAGFRIARFFMETARAALRPGGRIYVVSKQPEWYDENMSQWFENVTIAPSKGYWIAAGTK
jgi:16S rRNA (guanine1207-N2)-methyltransferase